jgi:predicted flap endonuclease-1-like 5' DNA nuclease
MEQYQFIVIIAAVLVVIAIIALWALAGSSAGSASGKSAAGQALEESSEEVSDVLTEEDGPDGAIAADIAATQEELHGELPPVEDGKPRIAPAVGDPDDLRKLKGVGPKLNTLLADMGITRYDQIAAWSATDIAEVDQYLGTFKGRIARDNWVEQAGYLAKNDIAGFEAKYGKL